MKQRKQTQKTQASVKCDTKVIKVASAKGLHRRNKHQGRYNFAELVKALPELNKHLTKNPRGEQSINFSDPLAVKLLNKALLARYYSVTVWDIPHGYLCPPIPGRADYIHRAAELLAKDCKSLNQKKVRALDIGVGANCIYPIIGAVDYGWHYTGSDVDPVSVDNANRIAAANHVLKGLVACRLQGDSLHMFNSIIAPDEYYHITTCNPPFHKSLQEAQQGTNRKLHNLKANRAKRGQGGKAQGSQAQGNKFKADKLKSSNPALNFGGQQAELWCPGGEAAFIRKMANESRQFANQVLWFSTLISKKENVRGMRKSLEKLGASEVHVVEMSQGQKVSRFIAWTFLSAAERAEWPGHCC